MKKLLFSFSLLLFLAGCKVSQKTAATTTSLESDKKEYVDPTEDEDIVIEDVIIEERLLDTMFVSAPSPDRDNDSIKYTLEPFTGSHKRIHDLIHTKLELQFDWEEEEVLGQATLTLKPFFYPSKELVLDAKNFQIHQVSLDKKGPSLTYKYEDNARLVIDLGKEYTNKEEYTIYIDYTARPTETGGSAAITSDKGLFFINPRGEEDKPQQIWTQGETEWNSRWFPTIDKPNERCTQEMFLTVDQKYTTLSNGLLVDSKENNDGTRTDHWKMELPHAPYLFMIAIGEYAKVTDTWRNIPVEYYVEPEFKDDARRIFPNTVEMLEFFSTKLGLDYPWAKYSQIIVRDYVSGAMENTTSVIYQEFLQQKERNLIDVFENERIVAHELFHHWFGDYVTCEGWANLTMNEGFANYAEYMWFEHKYGREQADYHLLGEWDGYLSEAEEKTHPLIYFGYGDKEAMFDRHSYNKGGAVLHMLRNYVGDEAFFAALNNYLTTNAYTAVEVHDLRLAFERVTGEDLNWFFNQWYLDEGHPELYVSSEYDETQKQITLNVQQYQDGEKYPPIFQLPVDVDIYLDGNSKPRRERIWINKRDQKFTFDVPNEPKLVNFDGDKVLLCILQDDKGNDEFAFQYFHASAMLDRYEAVARLTNNSAPEAKQVLKAALDDSFWVIRVLGIMGSDLNDQEVISKLRELSIQDPHSQVRATSLDKLIEADDLKAADVAIKLLEKEQAYPVISAALDVLAEYDKEAAQRIAPSFEKEEDPRVLLSISDIYGEAENSAFLPFFQRNIEEADGLLAIAMFGNYQGLLVKVAELKMVAEEAEVWKKIALSKEESDWRKVAATKALVDTQRALDEKAGEIEDDSKKSELSDQASKLKTMFDIILNEETNADLIDIYSKL